MKIAYITMQFPAPSETFASNDVCKLRERGVDVSVHSLRPSHRNHERLVEDRELSGLTITSNSLASSLWGMCRALARPRTLAGVVSWLFRHCGRNPRHLANSFLLLPRAFDIVGRLEQEQPDVAHIYWAHYPSLVGHLVQELLPEVATTVSFIAYDVEFRYGGSTPVARRADGIRTLAQVNVGQLHDWYGLDPKGVNLIYDGVDTEKVGAACAGVEKEPGLLVTVGRLTRGKGMYDALEVLARLCEHPPGARLRVLGDGIEANGLRRRARELGIEERVEFLGHVSQEEVFSHMARAQVLLLLTKGRGERLPNVVKEGMACGCYCITTPTAGIEELIKEGETGSIVPMGDVDAAAQAARAALVGELDKETLARLASQHVFENFSLDRCIDRYLSFWQEAIARGEERLTARDERQARRAERVVVQ